MPINRLFIASYNSISTEQKSNHKFVGWENKVCSCTAFFVSNGQMYKERIEHRGYPKRMNKLGTAISQEIIKKQKNVFSLFVANNANANIIKTDKTITEFILQLYQLNVDNINIEYTIAPGPADSRGSASV